MKYLVEGSWLVTLCLWKLDIFCLRELTTLYLEELRALCLKELMALCFCKVKGQRLSIGAWWTYKTRVKHRAVADDSPFGVRVSVQKIERKLKIPKMRTRE